MSYRNRLAVIASLLALPLIGFTGNALAESEESPVAICTQQAEENGLSGADRDEFIKDCVKNLGESGDK